MYKDGKLLDMSRKPIDFKVPERYYLDYYEKISNNGPFYVIMSVKGNGSSLFFSPYQKRKNEFVSYVFFREVDAEKFLQVLKNSHIPDVDTVVMWGCTATILVNSYTRIIKKEKKSLNKKRGFHIITSIFLHDEFREMEDFWTEDKSKMN